MDPVANGGSNGDGRSFCGLCGQGRQQDHDPEAVWQYQAAKVSADGNRTRRIRSIRRCDRANEMQDLIDKYADSNGFRYVGRLKADELEMDW